LRGKLLVTDSDSGPEAGAADWAMAAVAEPASSRAAAAKTAERMGCDSLEAEAELVLIETA
jgi:hypothetical protein